MCRLWTKTSDIETGKLHFPRGSGLCAERANTAEVFSQKATAETICTDPERLETIVVQETLLSFVQLAGPCKLA